MKQLYDKVCLRTSKLTTNMYSTSFSLGIRFLGKDIRDAIFAVYGLVRFADEIVDTFHDYNKERLLADFKADTYRAIEDGISLNPILNSFQFAVNKYDIDRDLIETFFNSMEMDLEKRDYTQDEYETYILGSAEVVGLMCLQVFLEGDKEQYAKLKGNAMSLGSAFQKINFLRDLGDDFEMLGRTYFPGLDLNNPSETSVKDILADIEKDFKHGYEGILKLPKKARFGVYMAYIYYYRLFKKIKSTPFNKILETRIRIPNQHKYALFVSSYVKHQLNII
ncbi:phytoene/squalene synthase family protein [Luteibaculum oceani]|uniref:Phytoene/squalene synthase family protein n=1 Tax=Luteibaculum oceani TaxID=1294296 RepID=A0A5C6VKT4_9FLAO|nr:phytoene/squalene synthase family protein [Luteibaculum oceani]TXC85344.1 phytoene/squalene synthase family protein [Luteibaculum oceani]